MRGRLRIPLLAVGLLLGGGAVATAAGVTVATGLLASSSKTLAKATCTLSGTQSTDTFVNEANTSQTNGSASSLVVENLAGQRRRAFVRFDFSQCANAADLANASVDSATLTLTFSSSSGTPRTIKVYRVATTWASTINWSTQPALGPQTTTISLTTVTPGAKTADVTQDVNDFLQSAPTPRPPYPSTVDNFGWALTDEGAGTGISSFNSAEASSGKPTLTFTYAF